MIKKYRVLFNGVSGDEEDFKSRMVFLFADIQNTAIFIWLNRGMKY